MPSVGAVTSNLNVTTKTANYTAVANDLVLANATSGAITVTMPNAPVLNTVVAVKKTDSSTNAVTIVPGTNANLNGDTSALLAVAGAAATFQYDGTNWQLISTGTINQANAAAGLPVGGSTDQVLKKNSSSNYDVSWTTASAGGGNFNQWLPGRTYFSPSVLGSVGQLTTYQYPANTTLLWPIRVPNNCQLLNISIPVNASATLYLGMFADNPNTSSGGPSTRLFTTSGAMGGQSMFNTTPNLAITAQTIWMSICVSAASSLYTPQNQLMNMVSGTPSTIAANAQVAVSKSPSGITSTPPVDFSAYSMSATAYPPPLFLFTIS